MYFFFRKFYLYCNDAAGQFLCHFWAFIFVDDGLVEEVSLYIVSDLMMRIRALGFAGERKCLTSIDDIV